MKLLFPVLFLWYVNCIDKQPYFLNTTLTSINQFELLKTLFAASLPDILKLYTQK